METVLIVEDEKMIRAGIKTMLQRSGVPIKTILECNNGEAALEILKNEKVDVMLTDIRMPKMDGIQLVQHLQELEQPPLTVAISGYDDFSYAVEMLRQGVREYILKPVEREKIQMIMEKLEAELVNQHENLQTNRKIGYQQLKYIMMNEKVTEEEIQILQEQYGKEFCVENYYVCCSNGQDLEETEDDYVYLTEIGSGDLFIVPEGRLEHLMTKVLSHQYVGISGRHRGISELQNAYKEALFARHRAFCRKQNRISYENQTNRIPEEMIINAQKRTSQEERLQRVQLPGTDRTAEMSRVWEQFFHETGNGSLTEEEFQLGMSRFFMDVRKTYGSVLEADEKVMIELEEIWKYACLDEYKREFMEWLSIFHQRLNSEMDENKNQQKIQQAVEYMKKNYEKDLNMAVVSNYISMNYSMFSYSFKLYTGNNFVNFLKSIRTDEAKRLLVETELKINEISQKVGYQNEKNFMKIFRSVCGVSPTEYRKNMKR